jgi:hypothetical protein
MEIRRQTSIGGLPSGSELTHSSSTDGKSNNEIVTIAGHQWRSKYLKKPTWCAICSQFIVGVMKSQQHSYTCLLCDMECHMKCCTTYTVQCSGQKMSKKVSTRSLMGLLKSKDSTDEKDVSSPHVYCYLI